MAIPSPQSDGPAGLIVAITKGSNILANGPTRGLLVDTAGTLNVTDAAGNDVDGVPAQAGYNPLSVIKVRSGGTAGNVWALY